MISPAIMRNTIVSNYVNIFENYSSDRRGNPVKYEPTCEQVREFRTWLEGFIVQSEVIGSDGARVLGADVISNDAMKKESTYPYGLLFPAVTRALNALKKEQLVRLFGLTFALRIFNPKYQISRCT